MTGDSEHCVAFLLDVLKIQAHNSKYSCFIKASFHKQGNQQTERSPSYPETEREEWEAKYFTPSPPIYLKKINQFLQPHLGKIIDWEALAH